MYDAYREAGGNFFDTANYYTTGTSEKLFGEFIAGERERVVVATKFTLNMVPEDPNMGGNHRKNIVQAVEASLRRLNTDYIDLYWLHAWDYTTPVDEIMRALDDLVRAGKVIYVGISDTPAWIVSQANTLADLRGWSPFVGLQIKYSLIERTVERDLLPMARALDIAVTPWSPLGAGLLTGKFNHKDAKPKPEDARLAQNEWGEGALTERNLRIAKEVEETAKQIGCSSAQVAINWIRRQPGVMIPIIGARRLDQLKDNLGCLDFTLDEPSMERLNEVSAIELGFPHDFLGDENVQNIIYGETLPKLDNHRSFS